MFFLFCSPVVSLVPMSLPEINGNCICSLLIELPLLHSLTHLRHAQRHRAGFTKRHRYQKNGQPIVLRPFKAAASFILLGISELLSPLGCEYIVLDMSGV